MVVMWQFILASLEQIVTESSFLHLCMTQVVVMMEV